MPSLINVCAGLAVLTTDDSSKGTEYAIRLANHVWCVFCCLQGPDRYACGSPCARLAFIPHLERIANSAFEIVTRLNRDHFDAVVRYGAFADLTVCITEFCKVSKYQKISLLAIAMLRGVIPVMRKSPECPFRSPQPTMDDDAMIRYWYPVLFGFYDIIMNGEDLEVRRL